MTYTVYTKPGCSFCVRAKNLLQDRGLTYTEVVLDVGQARQEGQALTPMAEFKAKFPAVKSLPYIILENTIIGGYIELARSLG